MILIPGQLVEARRNSAAGGFTVPSDNRATFVYPNSDRTDGFSLTFARQLALACRSKVANPLGLAIGRDKIPIVADVHGYDRYLPGLTTAAANHCEGGSPATVELHR